MKDKLFYHGRSQKYVAEMVGTFFLVFTVGCSVHTASIGAAVSIGAMLMVMVYSLGSVSGAHLNPAVTCAIALCGRGKIDFQDACAYILCQVSGAIIAAITYMVVFQDAFGLSPALTYTHHDAAAVEVLYTFALCYVVLNVATTENRAQGNPMPNHFFGLAIGLTVTAAAIAIGPISGCSLNPAVSVGSLFAHMAWHENVATRMWALYVMSPLGGSVLAAIFFYAVQGGFSGKYEYEMTPSMAPTPRPAFPYQVAIPRDQMPTRNLKREEVFWLPEDVEKHKLNVGISWKVEESMGGSVDIDASCVKFTKDGRALQSIYFENRFGKEIKEKNGQPEQSIVTHLGDNLTGHGEGFGMKPDTSRSHASSSSRVNTARSSAAPASSRGSAPPSSRGSKSTKNIEAAPEDDELIEINTLSRLRQFQPRCEYLFMTVNIFSQATKFEKLTEMRIRIVDVDDDGRELCYFEKLDMTRNKCNGFVLGVMFWRLDRWCFKAIDESFEMPEHKTIRYLEPKLAKIVKQMEEGKYQYH